MSEKLSVLDLFSGIGGFSLGLERTGGFETIAFCEIDPFCRAVLAKHWPDVPCHDDITTREFTKGEADVICGGFPCQDVSVAGTGAGLAGERSGLYRHAIRAIRLVRPLYAILENVAALLSRGMGTVLGNLAEIGYDSEWHCIPALRLGAPHERDRVWITAYPDSGRWWTDVAGRNDANRTNARRSQADCLLGKIPEPSAQWYLATTNTSNDNSERRRQYNRPGIAVPPGHSGLAEPISHDGWETPWPRFLADLCRMDDGLRGRLDKAGFGAIGNAVVPQIPEIIGRAILQAQEQMRKAA